MTNYNLCWVIAYMCRCQDPAWTACFEFADIMGLLKRCGEAATALYPVYVFYNTMMEQFVLPWHLR